LLIGALVAIINLLLWRAFNPPLTAPDVPSRVAGLAYNGFPALAKPAEPRGFRAMPRLLTTCSGWPA
jgi:hypothetical protein